MTAAFYQPSPAARAAVRAFAEGHMLATVEILRGTLGTLNTTTGVVGGLTSISTVYTGPARIKPVSPAGNSDGGGGPISQRDCEISIPMTASVPRENDLVHVIADLDADLDLSDRVFTILGVAGGSFFGHARLLQCMGWAATRYWKPS